MLKSLMNWVQRNESVRELSALSDHALADLGIARVDITTVVAQAQMNRDAVSGLAPRQTLSRLGGEQTSPAVETFA